MRIGVFAILALVCAIPVGCSCRKKSKTPSIIVVWSMPSVDPKAGVIRVEIAFPSEVESDEKKVLDEKRMKGAATGKLFGDVQEMVTDIPEAVIRMDGLMRSIRAEVQVEEGAEGRRVKAVATLPLNGEQSLATVLGCREVKLKGPRPGWTPEPTTSHGTPPSP